MARPGRGRPQGGRRAQRLLGQAGPPPQAGKRAQTTLERWQQVHDLLGKGLGLLECSRRLNLSLNTVKRYARATQPERLQRAPQYRPTLVDPYRDHLRSRRAENPAVPVQQLLREIRELGYQGSSNLLVRYLTQGRAEADRPHLSPAPRGPAPAHPARQPHRQPDATLAGLAAACPEMTALAEPRPLLRRPADPGPGQRRPPAAVDHRRPRRGPALPARLLQRP